MESVRRVEDTNARREEERYIDIGLCEARRQTVRDASDAEEDGHDVTWDEHRGGDW